MYASMAERSRYREVLLYTAVVILCTYAFIMMCGYHFFAQYTLSPGTVRSYLHSTFCTAHFIDIVCFTVQVCAVNPVRLAQSTLSIY